MKRGTLSVRGGVCSSCWSGEGYREKGVSQNRDKSREHWSQNSGDFFTGGQKKKKKKKKKKHAWGMKDHLWLWRGGFKGSGKGGFFRVIGEHIKEKASQKDAALSG